MTRVEQIVGTYSIVARDPQTGEMAVAVQSRFLAVGAVVPWAQANVGVIATQALANVTYGPNGLAFLREGLSATEVLERLTANDDGREQRQLAVVDKDGNAAAFTGSKCTHWAGHHIGKGYSCQGNILVGEQTVMAMAEAYESSQHLPHLADRVVEALFAAERAGGDSRGRQSAALYVVRERGGYAGLSDRLVDLRVDDHPEPVAELHRLLELHRQVWLGPTPPERYLLNNPERIRMVQALLRELGIFDGAVNGELTYNTRGSLAAYCQQHNLKDLSPSGEWLPGLTMMAMRDAVLKARDNR